MARGTPEPSSDEARRRMESTGQRDTAAELALRSVLHRKGLRFRVDQAPIRGVRRRADIVFRKARVAVYVDGCFWHCCPVHGTWPKANAEWWRGKLETNHARDVDTDRKLRDVGWIPVRVWEHEDPQEAADRIEQLVRERF